MDALLETIAAGVAVLYLDREIPGIQEVEDLLGRMLTQQEYEQTTDTMNRVDEMIDESAEKRARTLASERVRELPTTARTKPGDDYVTILEVHP
jgi:spore cortex formation protein SpoVR/YcgB (stage V sporulation)